MTTENWSGLLSAAHASDGPADPLSAPLVHLATTGAVLARESVARFLRRNPRREVASTYPLFSEHRIRFGFEVGTNLEALQIALASLGDSRSTASLFRFGRPDPPVRRHFVTKTPDGQTLELRDATCETLTLTVEPRAPVQAATIWPGWQLSSGSDVTPAAAVSGRGVSHADCSITLGTESAAVFSASVELSREVRAAGYRASGAATAWSGLMATDIVGKLTARASAGWLAAALFTHQTDDLTLTITLATGVVLTLTLPDAVFMARGKPLIGRDLWEWQLEFVATAAGQDVGTFTMA